MKVYSLKSRSLGYFNNPFVMPSEAAAIYNVRSLVNLGQDPSLNQNLDDLDLVELAEFDPKLGFKKIRIRLVSPLTKIPGILLPGVKDDLKEGDLDEVPISLSDR